ncbi:membrane dipeptidase, partial [Salmonella enterica]|uniref:membrane dipeptidase n=1 Tax=Salmonella enterica TaxID=28901 RepID=UPI001654480B
VQNVQNATKAAKGGAEFRAAASGEPTAPPPPATAAATASSAEGPKPGETIEERAARLHRQAIIVDGHNDVPSVMLASNYDLATKSARTHTDLARMKTGGITAEFFSIYVEGDLA